MLAGLGALSYVTISETIHASPGDALGSLILLVIGGRGGAP